MELTCNHCAKLKNTSIICRASDLVFCLKDKAIHLALRRNKSLETLIARENPKEKNRRWCPMKYFCRVCNGPVANGMLFGPNKEELVTFDSEDVTLDGTPTKSWRTIHEQSAIPTQTNKEIFEVSLEAIVERPKERTNFYNTDELKNLRPWQLINNHIPRDYQLESAIPLLLGKNLLVTIPTGFGKTLIAILSTMALKQRNPKKKCVLIVDRVTLVLQHRDSFVQYCGMPISDNNNDTNDHQSLNIVPIYGEISNQTLERQIHNGNYDILICTAQILENYLEDGVMDLEDLYLLIADEAHNTRRDHPYRRIFNRYAAIADPQFRPLILALTASPTSGSSSSDIERNLRDLEENLKCELYLPECLIRNSKKPKIDWIRISRVESSQTQLEAAILDVLYSLNQTFQNWPKFRKDELKTRRYLGQLRRQPESKTILDAIKIFGCLDLNEVQGPEITCQQLRIFLEGRKDSHLAPLKKIVDEILQVPTGKYSQKTENLLQSLKSPDVKQAIIFAKRKFTVSELSKILGSKFPRKVGRIVGHSGDGMTAEEQEDAVAKFRNSETKYLVATSVIEEGFDIPNCNFVLCYDGVRSLKAFVQSRGRARSQDSTIQVFTTNLERDFQLENQEREVEIIFEKRKKRHDVEPLKILENWMELLKDHVPTYTKSMMLEFRGEVDEISEMIDGMSGIVREGTLIDVDGHVTVQVRVQSLTNIPDLLKKLTEMRSNVWILSRDLNSESRTLICDLRLGNFSDRKFFSHGTVGQFLCCIDVSTRMMIFSQSRIEMHVAFETIQSWIVIDSVTAGYPQVYIPVRQPPHFYYRKESSVERFVPKDFSSFGNCHTLRLDFPGKTLQDLGRFAVLSQFSIQVYHGMVPSQSFGAIFEEISSDFRDEVDYLLRCLTSQFPAFLSGCSRKDLKLDEKTLEERIDFLKFLLSGNFQTFKEAEKMWRPLPSFQLEDVNDDKHAWIRRAIITPTRCIFLEPIRMLSNRCLRRFGSSIFLKVQFRDENMQLLRDWSDSMKNRMGLIMNSGIPESGILEFPKLRILGCSPGQLRDQSCWFVDCSSRDLREEIYLTMGQDLFQLESLPGIVSRFGMCLSSTEPTVQVEKMQEIPDVKSKDEKYTFTDGIGRISGPLFRKICEKIGKDPNFISAVQIRFRGMKGVVSVLSPEEDVQDCVIYWRNSMHKFESDYSVIDVVSVAGPNALYFNREIINILRSRGVPDMVFLKLQEDHLKLLKKPFTCVKEAVKAFAPFRPDFPGISDDDILIDSLSKGILYAKYRYELQLLRNKANIYVPMGRLLMGVVDETGTLQQGQVYIQYTPLPDEENYPPRVVEGPIVVGKNPCLHPGDIRRLTAVDNPKLSHHKNCIVFPAQGSRPHPDECSGSDLDGDRYWVSWHQDLIPTADYDPMEHIPKKKLTHHLVPMSYFGSELADHLITEMSNNQLGTIANFHLALSDQRPEGVCDPDCIEIAHQQAIEVDAVKTGIHGEIPMEIQEKVKEFPDFMLKPDKMSYPSKTVLGRLWSQASYFKLNAVVDDVIASREIPEIEFFQEYLKDAENTFQEYSRQVSGIFKLYGISEVEIISGKASDLRPFLRSDAKKSMEIVQLEFKKIQDRFKLKFNETTTDPAEKRKKACAWYHVAYQPNSKFLSFGWISASFLPPGNSGKSHLGPIKFSEKTKTQLFEHHVLRENIFDEISLKIRTGHPDVTCHVYGSSSYFLAADDSDLDICLTRGNGECGGEEQLELLKAVKETLSQSYSIELVENTKVPILRFQLENEFQVEISANHYGLQKRDFVLSYLKTHPNAHTFLYTVCDWGRRCGLITHDTSSTLSTYGLICLAIDWLENSRKFPGRDPIQLENISHWRKLVEISPGTTWKDLGEFFQFFANSDKIVQDPVQLERPLFQLENIPRLRSTFNSASHLVFIWGRKFVEFSSNFQRLKVIRVDRLTMSRIKGSEHVIASKMSTGCQVSVTCQWYENLLRFHLRGDSSNLKKAEKTWKEILQKFRKMPMPLKGFHIANSGIILWERSQGPWQTMSRDTYFGEKNPMHEHKICRSFFPRENFNLELSESHNSQKFESHVISTLREFKSSHDPRIFGKIIRLKLRMGHVYFFNSNLELEEKLTVTESDVVRNLAVYEKGRKPIWFLERQVQVEDKLKIQEKVEKVEKEEKEKKGNPVRNPNSEISEKSRTGIAHSFFSIFHADFEEISEFLKRSGFQVEETWSFLKASSVATNSKKLEEDHHIDIPTGKIVTSNAKPIKWLVIDRCAQRGNHDIRICLDSMKKETKHEGKKFLDPQTLEIASEYRDRTFMLRKIDCTTFSNQYGVNIIVKRVGFLRGADKDHIEVVGDCRIDTSTSIRELSSYIRQLYEFGCNLSHEFAGRVVHGS